VILLDYFIQYKIVFWAHELSTKPMSSLVRTTKRKREKFPLHNITLSYDPYPRPASIGCRLIILVRKTKTYFGIALKSGACFP